MHPLSDKGLRLMVETTALHDSIFFFFFFAFWSPKYNKKNKYLCIFFKVFDLSIPIELEVSNIYSKHIRGDENSTKSTTYNIVHSLQTKHQINSIK